MIDSNEIIVYQTDQANIQLQVRLEDELIKEATVTFFATVQIKGDREVIRNVNSKFRT